MTELWTALAAALVLAAAVGLDLYLVLFVVALAPLGGWTVPVGLEGLSTPLVATLAGSLLLMEFVAERSAAVAAFWHLVQSFARPVAAGLLAFMVIESISGPAALQWVVPITAAAVAFLVHAAKVGWFLLGWLSSGAHARPLLVSLGEDSVALGLASLAFDAPRVGAGLVLTAVLLLVTVGRALLRAGGFSHYLAWSRSWGSLLPFRWRGEEELPRDLAAEVAAIPRPLGHRLKIARAAGMRLRVGGLFRPGWIVVGPADPRWVCRSLAGPRMHVLDADESMEVRVEPLFAQISMVGSTSYSLIFPRSGPTVDAVTSEFGISLQAPRSREDPPNAAENPRNPVENGV